MHDDLLMFPIIGWEITMVPSEEMICVHLTFLASPFEKLTEANPGKPHVMHAEQAREFRDALTRMIQRIDDYESEGSSIGEPRRRAYWLGAASNQGLYARTCGIFLMPVETGKIRTNLSCI